MKIICIASESTANLLRLIGIEARILTSDRPQQFQEEMDRALTDTDIGLILYEEIYAEYDPKYIRALKTRQYPILIEIPNCNLPLNNEAARQLTTKLIGLSLS